MSLIEVMLFGRKPVFCQAGQNATLIYGLHKDWKNGRAFSSQGKSGNLPKILEKIGNFYSRKLKTNQEKSGKSVSPKKWEPC